MSQNDVSGWGLLAIAALFVGPWLVTRPPLMRLYAQRIAAGWLLAAVLGGAFVSALAFSDRSLKPDFETVRDLRPVPRASIAFPDRLMVGPYWCDADCSGHIAGWDWAVANRADDVSDCQGSRSNSFYEGCHLFLEASGLADRLE